MSLFITCYQFILTRDRLSYCNTGILSNKPLKKKKKKKKKHVREKCVKLCKTVYVLLFKFKKRHKALYCIKH